MFIKKAQGPMFIALANGRQMSRADLPPAQTKRWVASRKAKVVLAVAGGLLNAEEACTIYDLSSEELDGWTQGLRDRGVAGLKVTLSKS